MKKSILLTAISGFSLLAACHKDNKEPAQTGDGYWTFYARRTNSYIDTTYSIHYTARSTKNGYAVLSGMDAGHADSLQLWFKTMPVANSQYKIVLFPGTIGLGDNEMGLTINIPAGNLYTSTGIGSNATWLPPDNAVVSVTAGKIKVDIPQMTLIWTNSVTKGWDSTLLSHAILIEK